MELATKTPIVVRRISDKLAESVARKYRADGYRTIWHNKPAIIKKDGWEPALKDGAEIQCGTLTLMVKKPKSEPEQEQPTESPKQKAPKQKAPKESE